MGVDSLPSLEEFRNTAPRSGFVDKLVLNRVQGYFDRRASQETLANRAEAELRVQTVRTIDKLDNFLPTDGFAREGLEEIRDETDRMLADFNTGFQVTLHSPNPDLETLEVMATHASHLRNGESYKASAFKFSKSKLLIDIEATADLVGTLKTFESTDAKLRDPQELVKSVYRIFYARLAGREEIPTLLSEAKVVEDLKKGLFSPSVIRAAEKKLAGTKPGTEQIYLALNRP